MPQIRKFADLIYFSICGPSKCGYLWICDLGTIYFLRFADLWFGELILFGGLQTSANQQMYNFLCTSICIKCFHSNLMTTLAFGTVLRQSYLAFRSLMAESNQHGSWSETLLFSLKICGFVICGLWHQGNLRINYFKFADLRFADWHHPSFCGFSICGLIITNLRICDLRIGTPQKFTDLRLRIAPKNMRICWTNKKIGVPNFDRMELLYWEGGGDRIDLSHY